MQIYNAGWLYNFFWKCLFAEAVPFIKVYFPIFAWASSAHIVASRLRLDCSCLYRSSTSATNIAHINKYKLEIDVNVEPTLFFGGNISLVAARQVPMPLCLVYSTVIGLLPYVHVTMKVLGSRGVCGVW